MTEDEKIEIQIIWKELGDINRTLDVIIRQIAKLRELTKELENA